jgi:L-fuconolactonase
MIIDSHQHFWQVGRFDYPWMSSDLGVLYQDYLPPRLEPVLKANGVEKTVLVQASNSLAESKWLLELTDRYRFIAGVVGWVDLMSSTVDDQIKQFVRHPRFKGVRHLVESEPADDWLAQPAVLRGMNRLAAHGLSYDLLVHTRHLRYIRTIAEHCPTLHLVIDHMAKPPISSGELDDWSREFRPLAEFSNLQCKLSGLVTEANWSGWTADDLRPYIDCALDSFGPDRLMFGSDHPVCLLAASYERVLDSFREALKDLSATEQNKIFHDNAVRFYSLECGDLSPLWSDR